MGDDTLTSGQGIALSAQDEEMQCRSEGANKSVKCKSAYGTAIMKYKNASELLTIQNQMSSLSTLNENKIKFSRVFDIMSTILPSYEHGDDDDVKVSEINADIVNSALSFDAIGRSKSGLGFRSLEAFRKSAERTYFDYGSYMRLDKETNEYVAIPSFCIEDTIDTSTNIAYGIYHKGKPGCEAPMVEKAESAESEDEQNKSDEDEDENGTANEDEEKSKTNGGRLQSGIQSGILGQDEGISITTNNSEIEKKAKEETVVEDIWIRRTYANSSDREEYKKGNDRFAKTGTAIVSGYYFESECLQYDSDGQFDEVTTHEACPLLTGDVVVSSSSFGKDSNDDLVSSFSVMLPISNDVYLSKNHHMMIVGPNRQNVTDSYIQVHDMFEAAVSETEEGGVK